MGKAMVYPATQFRFCPPRVALSKPGNDAVWQLVRPVAVSHGSIAGLCSSYGPAPVQCADALTCIGSSWLSQCCPKSTNEVPLFRTVSRFPVAFSNCFILPAHASKYKMASFAMYISLLAHHTPGQSVFPQAEWPVEEARDIFYWWDFSSSEYHQNRCVRARRRRSHPMSTTTVRRTCGQAFMRMLI